MSTKQQEKNHKNLKIALVLAGCGYLDGTETTEAVSAILALSELGITPTFFALDQDFPTKNHLNSEQTQSRNSLIESARITRGNVHPLKKLDAKNFSGLIIPGGFGIALNLCDWAQMGAEATVEPQIKNTIRDFYKAKKPITAICISPVLLAKSLEGSEITVTLGDDKDTHKEVEKTGTKTVACNPGSWYWDTTHKIASTPAYMQDTSPFMVYKGIKGAIQEMISNC